jgi:hypothetical protein
VENEREAFVSETRAQEKKVGNRLGDQAKRTVGGRGEVEAEKVRVEADVRSAQLRQHAALRAAEPRVHACDVPGRLGIVEEGEAAAAG